MKKILIVLVIAVSANLFGEIAAEKDLLEDCEIRLIYGEAMYSSLREIVTGKLKKDFQESSLIGIQVNQYLEKGIYDDKIDISAMWSVFLHKQSTIDDDAPYQDGMTLKGENTFQYNFGARIYWKDFPWNKYVRTKFSVAEGLSYTLDYLDIERQNYNKETLENKSLLLNYLEFNLHFNLGDTVNIDKLEKVNFGIGISHRSGVYGLFNGVVGGSNFITVFIETEI